MHVLVILLSILGLTILIFAGLWTLIRHAVNDSIYAAPVAPSTEGYQWRDTEHRRDTEDSPSSSMSSRSR